MVIEAECWVLRWYLGLISLIWGQGTGWRTFREEAEAAGDKDRSLRRALPVLLVEWSFEGSRLFITQDSQRQLLPSGDGFSNCSQWS